MSINDVINIGNKIADTVPKTEIIRTSCRIIYDLEK